MTTDDNTNLYDYLVAEYNHHFDYWDWSYLDGRRVDMTTGPKPWEYIEAVRAEMQKVHSVLDMRTGSGEIFAGLLKQQPVAKAHATDGYAPNIAMARQVLEPLGVTIYEVHDERIPLADADIELVINRHGSYDPHEVLRVLKPGQLFITQQVGDQTNRRIHELLGREKKQVWNLDSAVSEMRKAGGRVVEQQEHHSIMRFYDMGALVYYLKAIPWEVPDFSIERYFGKLVEINHIIQQEGYLDVPFHTFFFVACVAN